MKEKAIIPPLSTTTKGGQTALVEYVRASDPLDTFRGVIVVNEFGSQIEVTWGIGGICRDSPDTCNLTKDSPGFKELREKYLRA